MLAQYVNFALIKVVCFSKYVLIYMMEQVFIVLLFYLLNEYIVHKLNAYFNVETVVMILRLAICSGIGYSLLCYIMKTHMQGLKSFVRHLNSVVLACYCWVQCRYQENMFSLVLFFSLIILCHIFTAPYVNVNCQSKNEQNEKDDSYLQE